MPVAVDVDEVIGFGQHPSRGVDPPRVSGLFGRPDVLAQDVGDGVGGAPDGD